jgi:hypothetical protein
MNLDNPIRMVRELKGAPLSILFSLTIVQQRVSQAWLERTTGYTDKTISQALGYLEEIGLADHTSAGWQLTGKAKQLPLPMETIEPRRHEGHEEDQDQIEEQEVNRPANSDDIYQTRRISDPVIIITTDSNDEEVKSNNNNKGGRKNSDSGVLDALARAGIVGKKRQSLSQLAWVTVESVSAWEAALKRDKKERYSPGLLISVLESGDPAPKVVDKNDRRRYILGEFADFIEH